MVAQYWPRIVAALGLNKCTGNAERREMIGSKEIAKSVRGCIAYVHLNLYTML